MLEPTDLPSSELFWLILDYCKLGKEGNIEASLILFLIYDFENALSDILLVAKVLIGNYSFFFILIFP